MSSKFITNITVGNHPYAICDDAQYIWVSNENSNTASRINRNDVTMVDTILVGNNPLGIFSNGVSCFVANYSDLSITKIDAITLATSTISLSFYPFSVCADLTYLWVSHADGSLVTRILISDVSMTDDIIVGILPFSIFLDTTYCWVANYGSNTVSQIELADITNIQTISVGNSPVSITSDNVNCWVANQSDNSVTRISILDITDTETISVGPAPIGVSSDSRYVWVANSGNNTVSRILITDTQIITVLTHSDYGFNGVSAIFTQLNGSIQILNPLYTWVCNTGGFVTQILQYSPPPDSPNVSLVTNLNVEESPLSCSSDGTYCWIANYVSSSITQLTIADHTVTTISLDFLPNCIFSDGIFVWIADPNNAKLHQLVIELTPTPTPIINSITVSDNPVAVCSDGIHAWTANIFDTVTRILISNITNVHTFSDGHVSPFAVSSDGTYCWVANGDNTVSRILISDITIIDTIPVGKSSQSLSADGRYTWVANFDDNTVTQIDALVISNIFTIPVGIHPNSISSDGTYVWVANLDSTYAQYVDVYQIVIEPIPTNTPTIYWLNPDTYNINQTSSLTSDGMFLWVTNLIAGDFNGSISQIRIVPTPPPPIGNICFPKGTPITTDHGLLAIEDINPAIVTINGGQEIVAITQSVGLPEDYMVCFGRNSLGYGVPNADTVMSPAHKVLFTTKKGYQLVEAREFLGHFSDVKRVPYVRGTTLYNVLMKGYEIMWVNGMQVETLHPDNIIARLYVSDNAPELKQKFIAVMNDCIIKQLPYSYNRLIQRILD